MLGYYFLIAHRNRFGLGGDVSKRLSNRRFCVGAPEQTGAAFVVYVFSEIFDKPVLHCVLASEAEPLSKAKSKLTTNSFGSTLRNLEYPSMKNCCSSPVRVSLMWRSIASSGFRRALYRVTVVAAISWFTHVVFFIAICI